MKIYFELTEAQPKANSKFHGGGAYAFQLFCDVYQHLKTEYAFIILMNQDKWIDPRIIKIIENDNLKVLNVSNTQDLSRVISKHDEQQNTFFFPLPYNAVSQNKVVYAKCIITVHGLRTIELPSDRYYYLYKWPNRLKMLKSFLKHLLPENQKSVSELSGYEAMFKNIKPQDVILTDSNYSKNAIEFFFSEYVREAEVKVVYPKVEPIKVGEVSLPILEGKKFFLSLGMNRPVKNLLRVLDALNDFDFFEKIDPNVFYVITGIDSNMEKLIRKRYKNICSRLILLGYVEEDLKAHLLKNAKLFLYPSLNEGYGIPPVEASYYSCPSLCSYITSIPEVMEDAAEYFSPHSPADLINKLYLCLRDDNLLEKKKAMGLKRFSTLNGLADKHLFELLETRLKQA